MHVLHTWIRRSQVEAFEPNRCHVPCVPQFLEGALEGERKHTGTLSEQQAALEQRLQDALARNQQYEAGVYGLPQVGSAGTAPAQDAA